MPWGLPPNIHLAFPWDDFLQFWGQQQQLVYGQFFLLFESSASIWWYTTDFTAHQSLGISNTHQNKYMTYETNGFLTIEMMSMFLTLDLFFLFCCSRFATLKFLCLST